MDGLLINLTERELQVIIQGLGKLSAEVSFNTILKLQASYAGHVASKNKIEEPREDQAILEDKPSVDPQEQNEN